MLNPDHLDLLISPQGNLHIPHLPSEDPRFGNDLRAAFLRGTGHGLLHLGISEFSADLPALLTYWRDFARLFLTQLCAIPNLADLEWREDLVHAPIPTDELERFAASAPPMTGAEYLNIDCLKQLWKEIQAALFEAVKNDFQGDIQAFLTSKGPGWNLVGHVCFHLAENKKDEEVPFAFLATYTHQVSKEGRVQHLPLGRALQEYAGAKNKHLLLSLLTPVQKAAAQSPFLKLLVDSGEIFHPLAWSASEAYCFLKDIPVFESSGVVVRVPDWWKPRKPPRPQVSIKIGSKEPSHLSAGSLLDFSVELTLNGETLSDKEWRQILSATEGLVIIRGRWVEVDPDKLKEVLSHWKSVEKASKEGVSFIQGMRMLAGATMGSAGEFDLSNSAPEWSTLTSGPWLTEILKNLKNPEGKFKNQATPGDELKAVLRPYQQRGVEWLWLLNQLGLGACLADDMGLGKTVQVLSLLLVLKGQGNLPPSLLIVPASLIGNWKSEIEKFTPSLKIFIAHSSSSSATHTDPGTVDLVITTYSSVYRLLWISQTQWGLMILDEAQAIKNPDSKQTRSIKSLKSIHRLALTGTPVENHLSDLWSLFDFLCPGLLGSAKQFESFVKDTTKLNSQQGYGVLRKLVQPYILRRLKSDKSIIADLPDKTEMKAFCSLSKVQAALYQQSVEDLSLQLEKADGIQRRGVILAALMRLKQICNHPSQWLSDGMYKPVDSGKFARLRELCEAIAAKQEKVLIFTQFRELTSPIHSFLKETFGREGLILHGQTPIQKRKERVDSFQAEDGPPYFVLSLKAGGTGLNLTAASHVIHFDRWWNPAVENQATDRAYRIGQHKNVLVHKFVCRGTVEERIDALIDSKQSMSQEILKDSHEGILTEMPSEDLIRLVSLDLQSALEES